MSWKPVIELKAAIEQADGAIIAANHHLPSSARAALNLPCDFLGNRAFSCVFFLEELELPPLVHLMISTPEKYSLMTETEIQRFFAREKVEFLGVMKDDDEFDFGARRVLEFRIEVSN